MAYEGSNVPPSRLPFATGSLRGAVITGSNITNSSGTISLTSSNVDGAIGYNLDRRFTHATDALVLGNNDWSSLVYSGTAPVYDAAERGMSFTVLSLVNYVRVRMPVDPSSVYYLRAKVRKVSGDGKLYIGAISLDNNYAQINTDLASSWNYFAASNVSIAEGVTYTAEGTISGYNLVSENSNNKFDPEAKYFDLVLITNYQGTTGTYETIIESLELYRAPNEWIVNGTLDMTRGPIQLAVTTSGNTATSYIGSTSDLNSLQFDSNNGPILNSSANAIINIDSNNDSSTATFKVRSNTNTSSSGTDLLSINEAGDFAVLTNKFTVAGATGNSVVGGSLTVSGAGSTTGASTTINSGLSVIALNLGGNSSTSGLTADQYSSALRFNGSAVAWGDVAYYPNGGDSGEQGHFRFTLSPSAVDTAPDAKVGVGRLYAASAVLIGTTTDNGVDELQVTGTANITSNTAVGGTLTSTGLLTASNGFTLTTGTLTLPAASIADAALSSNIPKLNAANTFTANQIVSGASADNRLIARASSGVAGQGGLQIDQGSTYGFHLYPTGTGGTGGVLNIAYKNVGTDAVQNDTANLTFNGTITSTGTGGFSGIGTSLTALNGTNITSGTVADARLSANVPLLNASNNFTATTNRFGNIYIGRTNEINEEATNANASLYINYRGYNGGTTQFRDLRVNDGKNALILFVQGSTGRVGMGGNATPSTTLDVTGTFKTSSDAEVGGNLIVQGDLTVNGTTTTVNTTNLNVEDKLIALNKPATNGANDPVPTNYSGSKVYRGTVTSVERDNAGFVWDETNSRWIASLMSSDTVLTTRLALAALSLDVSSGLTVSGGSVSLPAASIADAALSANVVLENAANTFTTNLQTFNSALYVNNGQGLPAASSSGGLIVIGGGALSNPNAARMYWGDGTGWALTFATRAASTDTVRHTFTDQGAYTSTGRITAGNGLTVSTGTVVLPSASIADAALSANVPLENAANTFTNTNSFQSTVNFGTGGAPTFAGGSYGTGAPQVYNSQTTGEAAIGLFVNDGVNNRRVKFFVDQTNAVWGFKTSYSSGGIPFVINEAGSEIFRLTTAGVATIAGGLTVSAGSVSLPAASIADAALSTNVNLLNSAQTVTAKDSYILTGTQLQFGTATGQGQLTGTSSQSLINHGADYGGTNWTARQTSAAFVGVGSAGIDFYYNTGLTIGNTMTPTNVGSVNASGFSGNGSQLTSLNGSNISSGTVADARLSANVPLLNAANSFTAAQTIQGTAIGTPLSLFRDVGAGDSTNVVQLMLGNSGTNEGTVRLQYTNATAAGSPTAALSFQPRNNADTTAINPANITFTKTAAADTASVTISNTNGSITLNAGGDVTFTDGVTISSGGLTVTAGSVSLPATSIADAALSANVPLKNASNTFTGAQNTFGPTTQTGRSANVRATTGANNYFFGHSNTGYLSTIGAFNSSGLPFISFYSYHSATTNTLARASATNVPAILFVGTTGTLSYQTGSASTVDTDVADFATRFSVDASGTVTATTFSGSGASLTSLNGTNISSGTVADARLSGNVALKAGGNSWTGTQSNTGAWTIGQTTTDTAPTSYFGNSNLNCLFMDNGLGMILNTSHHFILNLDSDNNGAGEFQIRKNSNAGDLGTFVFSVDENGLVTGTTFSGSGASLTSLNGSNISTGTVADARLSANVDFLNVAATRTTKLTTVASGTGSAGFNLPHGSAPSSPTNGDVWTTTAGLYVRVNGSTVGPLSATTGTVTSVALSLPAIFSVSGSPVTTSGTLTATLANQNANLVFAGPSSGGAAAPTFRALVEADIPSVVAATASTTVKRGTDSTIKAANHASIGAAGAADTVVVLDAGGKVPAAAIPTTYSTTDQSQLLAYLGW